MLENNLMFFNVQNKWQLLSHCRKMTLLRNALVWGGVHLHGSDISWLGCGRQWSQISFIDAISKTSSISGIQDLTSRFLPQHGWSPLSHPVHTPPPLWASSSFFPSFHPWWRLQSTVGLFRACYCARNSGWHWEQQSSSCHYKMLNK